MGLRRPQPLCCQPPRAPTRAAGARLQAGLPVLICGLLLRIFSTLTQRPPVSKPHPPPPPLLPFPAISCDVAIIGGGPAGLTTAEVLAQTGWPRTCSTPRLRWAASFCWRARAGSTSPFRAAWLREPLCRVPAGRSSSSAPSAAPRCALGAGPGWRPLWHLGGSSCRHAGLPRCAPGGTACAGRV